MHQAQVTTVRPRRVLLANPAFRAAIAVLSLLCAAPSGCGGGGGGGFATSGPAPTPPTVGTPGTSLTEADVNTVVLQAINEANARGAPATIAVVDRVGNVLTVAQMPGAPAAATITSNRGVTTGLENPLLQPV